MDSLPPGTHGAARRNSAMHPDSATLAGVTQADATMRAGSAQLAASVIDAVSAIGAASAIGIASTKGAASAIETGNALLAGIAPLAAELATLKRIRDARATDSIAARLFRRAWAALCAGSPVRQVAFAVSADALAALRLAGIDQGVLLQAGLSASQAAEIHVASLDQVSAGLPQELRADLRHHAGTPHETTPAMPAFVEALIRQPRAGATCPGKPRLILEPPESHGDHCLAVAVLGVLLSAEYGADPAPVFLAGLAHHLHNATLPDAGFAGEILLGDHLVPVIRTLTAQALATLPENLAAQIRHALAATADAATPEGRAFNAADVIDRIMEVRHFAGVAGFTEAQALDEMQLVHAGPLQDFHHQVMRTAGLTPA